MKHDRRKRKTDTERERELPCDEEGGREREKPLHHSPGERKKERERDFQRKWKGWDEAGPRPRQLQHQDMGFAFNSSACMVSTSIFGIHKDMGFLLECLRLRDLGRLLKGF